MKEEITFSINFSNLWDVAIFINIIFLIGRATGLHKWDWYWEFAPVLFVGGLELIFLIIYLITLAVKIMNDKNQY